MKRTLLAVVAVALFAVISQTAWAGSINVSTGLDSSGALITTGGQGDANWTVGGNPAQVVVSTSADWYGGWVADGPNSDWIAINAGTAHNGPAPYTFSTTFDLTGYDLSTVSLSGFWTIDDGGMLDLNGNQIDSLSVNNNPWTSLHSFSTISSYFLPGINTLSITITDSDNTYEGVRLQGSVTGTTVPEPATLSLTLLGLAFLILAAWRKKLLKMA